MSRRARILRIEQLVSSKLKAQQERRKQWARALPIHAQRHATVVAAIVLAGEPKIDEPLIRAWARTLCHFKIAVWEQRQIAAPPPDAVQASDRFVITINLGTEVLHFDKSIAPDANDGDPNEIGAAPHQDPTAKSEQVHAAEQLLPIIVGKQELTSRFAEIFSTAPAWLLQFTRTVLDAWILRFCLPDMKPNSNWGAEGFADAEHWPFLPTGVLTAGDRIPHDDVRHMRLTAQSIVPPIDSLPRDIDLFAPTDDPSCKGGTILDDIAFAFSLDEKPESYERRRMQKILRRLSRDDRFDSLLAPSDFG
jgi:hypothetical protein